MSEQQDGSAFEELVGALLQVGPEGITRQTAGKAKKPKGDEKK